MCVNPADPYVGPSEPCDQAERTEAGTRYGACTTAEGREGFCSDAACNSFCAVDLRLYTSSEAACGSLPGNVCCEGNTCQGPGLGCFPNPAFTFGAVEQVALPTECVSVDGGAPGFVQILDQSKNEYVCTCALDGQYCGEGRGGGAACCTRSYPQFTCGRGGQTGTRRYTCSTEKPVDNVCVTCGNECEPCCDGARRRSAPALH